MLTTTVYVRLLDEGTDVFRPTEAKKLADEAYRLMPSLGYDPEDEKWEYLPGQIVRCELVQLHSGLRLVATSLA